MSTSTYNSPVSVAEKRGVGAVAAKFFRSPIAIASIATIALIILGDVISPGFASGSQIVNLLRVASFLGVLAVGQTIVMITGGGGLDLSVGKVATFAAIVASRIMAGDNANFVQGVVIALVFCALIGLGNGLGITFLSIPPFVMTLGMTGVVYGLIMVYTGGRAAGRAAPALTGLVNGKFLFGLPGVLFFWLLVTVVVTFILRRTVFGWRVFAVGTNRLASDLSAVPVRRTVIISYVAASVFAGLGGILLVGYTESVMLDLADSYTLPSIAAVIIGGTLAAGGIGSYIGTAVGAVTLTVLTSLLTTMNMGSAWRTIINGLVLVVLLSFYGRQKRLQA